MFGYIKPSVPELKVKEHELYKSIYCGLCRAMGEHICNSDRVTLSYDIVFLALVRCAVTGEEIHIEKRRCLVHPIKKRNHAFIPETLKYCARVSALLTYFNVEDDIKDTKGFASFKHKLFFPFAKKFLKKADMPELGDKVSNLLSELSELEKEEGSPDRNADCFGRLLGEIFAYNIQDPHLARYSFEIGYHCGKWIYITDAIDDFKRDKEKGEYNPFAGFDALPGGLISTSLTLELTSAHNSFNSLDIKNEVVASIINNILTLGMPEVQDNILGENK